MTEQKIYRVMFCEDYLTVRAENEDDAKRKASSAMIEALQASQYALIAWELDDESSSSPYASA